MNRTVLEIVKEPQGQIYKALVRFTAERCNSFSLVWCRQLDFDPSAQQFAVALQPWLISEAETKSWPGTKGPLALVRHYRMVRGSGEILQSVEGLYSWLAPDLPEDLAFYDATGRAWLTSVAHEKMAWIEDATLSLEEVRENVLGLEISRRRA